MEEEVKNKINEEVERQIKEIVNEGIQAENVNMLGKLVDIHKDLANEDYWCKKEEVMKMRYRGYDEGDYGRGRDSRGRYSGRMYPGGRIIEDMKDNYETYMESGGRYGGGHETDKAFDYMLESAEDFLNHLMEESNSPEQMEKVRRLAKRISEKRI